MSLAIARLSADERPHADLRTLVEDDASNLASLMLRAYRGTPDGEGESLETAVAEVRSTFEGRYGTMIWQASFAALAPGTPFALASAAVVTMWNETPLLAFSMTQPELTRRGLASRVIRSSARVLSALGYERLGLVVTRGNVPAERLYEKLGFEDVP